MDDKICAYPWVLVSVGSIGNLRPCCNAINADIEEIPGKVAKIAEKENYSIDSLLGNYTHEELRKSMLNNEEHPMCSRCWKMESAGIQSFRHHVNRHHPEALKMIREQRSEKPLRVERIEFDLGRKCNLRCRMCSPWSSSLISKELTAHPESKEYYGDFNEFDDWVNFVDIKEIIKPHIDTIREIYLIGGEPLIIDAHEKLLDYLVESGASSKILLVYNTNGITLKPKFIEQWSKFRTVQMNVSIDGIGKYYDYIRNPAKWETIEKNIDNLLEQIKDYPNILCGVSTTLQNLTVPCIFDLILWCDRKNLKVNVLPVNHPTFLQPDVMPEGKYDQFIEEMKSNLHHFNLNDRTAKEVVMYLEGNRKNLGNIELQKTFVKKQKLLDSIRNQDLFSIHPWVKDIV
ncbi:MAG: radical SAM protein [Bacteroidetes bacterium]|nr:radical SAM protein [bacterium]NBP63894.1 radical SAM protein [Bacteroidota bacterium]